MIEERNCVRVGSEGHVRLAGLAKPTGIEADHGEVFGEGRNLRVPHPAVTDPGMKQEYRRPAPGHVIRDLGAVHCGYSAPCLRVRLRHSASSDNGTSKQYGRRETRASRQENVLATR